MEVIEVDLRDAYAFGGGTCIVVQQMYIEKVNVKIIFQNNNQKNMINRDRFFYQK